MLAISRPDYIRCRLGSGTDRDLKNHQSNLEIFYAETSALSSGYPGLMNVISKDEALRAGRLRLDNDRETYITCHALLRLVIAQRLKVDPKEISFTNGLNNKPYIMGDPLFFNLTHTRESFSFAISDNKFIGIDLENSDQDIEFHSVARSFFSSKECGYIFRSAEGAKNRFFVLWTRKEALLKALGTGIIDDLTNIEVSGRDNSIDWNSLGGSVPDPAISTMFLYTRKIGTHFLSIAVPQRDSIKFYHLNKKNIVSYLR